MYHIGKVTNICKGQGNQETLATLWMWDENLMTFKVASSINKKLEKGDFVLVDYAPNEKLRAPVPRHIVCRILSEQEGQEIWKEYEKYHKMRKGTNAQQSQMEMPGGYR